MAERRGLRSRLFGNKASKADEQRKKQMEREREGTVDKKSLFKRVMRSDDGKKSNSSSNTRSRSGDERDRRGQQSFLEFSSKAIDSYETHTDPKKREAEAKRRHERGETADRRSQKTGKAQAALKVGKFLHKHSK